MRKGFLYIFFSHTDFSPKIQLFLAIYTDFVLDQSGRSIGIFRHLWCTEIPQKEEADKKAKEEAERIQREQQERARREEEERLQRKKVHVLCIMLLIYLCKIMISRFMYLLQQMFF